jgi:hypothetical protein
MNDFIHRGAERQSQVPVTSVEPPQGYMLVNDVSIE